MGINGATNEFMDNLTQLINTSKLPVVNIRLCLESARLQLLEIEKQAIAKEQEQEKEQAKAQATK